MSFKVEVLDKNNNWIDITSRLVSCTITLEYNSLDYVKGEWIPVNTEDTDVITGCKLRVSWNNVEEYFFTLLNVKVTRSTYGKSISFEGIGKGLKLSLTKVDKEYVNQTIKEIAEDLFSIDEDLEWKLFLEDFNVTLPYFRANDTALACLRNLMELCNGYFIILHNPEASFETINLDNSSGKEVLEYKSGEEIVKANRVKVYGGIINNQRVYGEANDIESQAKYGVIEEKIEDTNINSNSLAQYIADSRLNRNKENKFRGTVTTRLNLKYRPYWHVKIFGSDSRFALKVTHVLHEYKTTFEFGLIISLDDFSQIVHKAFEHKVLISGDSSKQPTSGTLFFNTSVDKLFGWVNNTWKEVAITSISHGGIDHKGLPILLSGLESQRPNAGVNGRIYWATDTSKYYYDNGSEWIFIGTSQLPKLEGYLQAYQVQANFITANMVSADIGILDKIWTDWITAKKFRTGGSGARIEIDSGGLRAYNQSNVETVKIQSSDGLLYAVGGRVVLGNTELKIKQQALKFYDEYDNLQGEIYGSPNKLNLYAPQSITLDSPSIIPYGNIIPVPNINLGSNTSRFTNVYANNLDLTDICNAYAYKISGSDFADVLRVQRDIHRFIPRTQPQNPLIGDMYYDSNANTLFYWNGSQWVSWSTTGHTHLRSDITDFWSTPFWNNIPDKPTQFPPQSHTHTRGEITDFWSTPFWNNIPDKPSTYPPQTHTHTRSEITDLWNTPFWSYIPDKPSTYPPDLHASTHLAGGSDQIFNQNLNTTNSPTFQNLYLNSLTAGSILFAGSNGLIAQDNANLYWDNVNKRLGIGTTSPAYKLDVFGDLAVGTSGWTRIQLYSSVNDTYNPITGGADTAHFHFGFPGTPADKKPLLEIPADLWIIGSDKNLKVDGLVAISGNVGIGTTSPAYKLDVAGDIRGQNNLYISGNVGIGTTAPSDKLHVAGRIITGIGGLSQGVLSILPSTTGSWFHIYNAGEGTLRIAHGEWPAVEDLVSIRAADGNVGIGTTTPEAKLDIVSGNQRAQFLVGTNSSSYTFQLGVNDDGVNFSNNSSIRGFNFKNANGTLVTITSSGNVGIGTIYPSEKLHVVGNINLSTSTSKVFFGSPTKGYIGTDGYNLILNSADYGADIVSKGTIRPWSDAVYDLGVSGFRFRNLNLTGEIVIGGDTRLYRSAVDQLKTDDSLDVYDLDVGGVNVISSDRFLKNLDRMKIPVRTSDPLNPEVGEIWLIQT